MDRTVIAALALALFGCGAAAPAPSPAAQAQGLAGSHWLIEAIDGKQPEPGHDGAKPALTFAGRSYAAYAGCNAMGGLYARRDERLYTLVGPSTAMACGGARGRQEEIVGRVLQQAPWIAGKGDRVTLRSGSHALTLRRASPPHPIVDVPEAWQGAGLAGQSFDMSWIDGDSLNRRPAPRLSFADRRLRIENLCGATVYASYRAQRGEVTVEGAPRDCLNGFFAGRTLSAVSGPNGELLLAGGGHWLGGDNIRRDRPK